MNVARGDKRAYGGKVFLLNRFIEAGKCPSVKGNLPCARSTPCGKIALDRSGHVFTVRWSRNPCNRFLVAENAAVRTTGKWDKERDYELFLARKDYPLLNLFQHLALPPEGAGLDRTERNLFD
jgi:hypothetical protein